MALTMSSSLPLELGSLLFRVQRVGENIFAAMIFVAFVQASIALVQYRTNPKGQLIIPPGLTVGIAEPKSKNNTNHRQSRQATIQLKQAILPPQNVTSNGISTETSQYARILTRINRWLVLLIPLASQKLGWILQRNTHLFHFGFIISLAGLFDIPNRWFQEWEGYEPSSPVSSKGKDSVLISASKRSYHKPTERIIVIGDSLAVGLGSVNIFDVTKTNSDPFRRIENTAVGTTPKDAPGPVFPRALAETLANRYQTKVHWRSAGVDGGDTAMIQEYCLGLIHEEVSQGRAPDLIVVLCGTNDLKYFVSNPFLAPGPRTFRQRLYHLFQSIQALAPQAKIIVPMIPTQMFRASSPLNIFPLNFFLDAVVGFWDSQKKLVTDRYPSDNVVYLGLCQSEIYEWYQKVEKESESESDSFNKEVSPVPLPAIMSVDEGLIAADGIHPNAMCYELWAKFLGDQLVDMQSVNP